MKHEKVLSHYKVNAETGCWIWAGWKEGGYGRFQMVVEGKKKYLLAHRYYHQHLIGPIPEGLLVMHKCNNRGCVNPDHLETGTNQDNMTYMVQCGRSHRPAKEKNPWFGKHLSAEHRAKLSKSRTGKCCGPGNPNFGKVGEQHYSFGKKHTEESIEKMRAAQKGKVFSAEHRANISAAKSGENHPMYGKKNSPETIAKRVASRKATMLLRRQS